MQDLGKPQVTILHFPGMLPFSGAQNTWLLPCPCASEAGSVHLCTNIDCLGMYDNVMHALMSLIKGSSFRSDHYEHIAGAKALLRAADEQFHPNLIQFSTELLLKHLKMSWSWSLIISSLNSHKCVARHILPFPCYPTSEFPQSYSLLLT